MVTIIVTMVDNNNNAYSFKKCNFWIRSGFKNKTFDFSNSVKWNTFGKFQCIILRVEKAFCFTSIFWGVIPGLFARFMKNIPGFELSLSTSQIAKWILAISIVKLEIIRKIQSSFSQRKFNSSILNFSRTYCHALYTAFLKKYCLHLKLLPKMQKMLLNFY